MLSMIAYFKQLLENFLDSFVDLFLTEIAGYINQAATYTELKTELFSRGGKHKSAEADLVFRVTFKEHKKDFLMHVETQAKFESDFGIRLLKYNALLLEKYKLPVYS